MGATLRKPEKDIYKRLRAIIELRGHKASMKQTPLITHATSQTQTSSLEDLTDSEDASPNKVEQPSMKTIIKDARKKLIKPTTTLSYKKSLKVTSGTQTPNINTIQKENTSAADSDLSENDAAEDTRAYTTTTSIQAQATPGPWIDITHQMVEAHEHAWKTFQDQVILAGDLEMLQAFPVYKEEGRAPKWKPFSYPIMKDVKKVIVEYGLNAPFTIGLMESFFLAYTLIPNDIHLIARAWLPVIQYSAFEAEWKALIKKYVKEGRDLRGMTPN
ncbi:hypothetical protein BTVI_05942 [Pitangus sulphuratus]|nr:hypothetical protein BTVI_05942 [Pitangus sulphuratus]